MRVFLLWFRHFEVSLFSHRHFRFIILIGNKINFIYQMYFTFMQVADLRRHPQERAFPAVIT